MNFTAEMQYISFHTTATFYLNIFANLAYLDELTLTCYTVIYILITADRNIQQSNLSFLTNWTHTFCVDMTQIPTFY